MSWVMTKLHNLMERKQMCKHLQHQYTLDQNIDLCSQDRPLIHSMTIVRVIYFTRQDLMLKKKKIVGSGNDSKAYTFQPNEQCKINNQISLRMA